MTNPAMRPGILAGKASIIRVSSLTEYACADVPKD